MAKKRHHRPRWYDVGQAIKLLLGLAEAVMELIRTINGG
jgi:hypothetical protein